MNNIIKFNKRRILSRKKLPKPSVKFKASTSFLEKKMFEHYELMQAEDFEKTIYLADCIIELNKTNRQAYLTAAMTCCYLDDHITATDFLDDMLKIYPSDTEALALKMEVHDILYTNTRNVHHLIKAIDISSKMLKITNKNPNKVIKVLNRCRCCRILEEKVIDKALDIEPDNEHLLYRKVLSISFLFEENKGSPESFSRLVSTITKMKKLYPESMRTKNILEDTYETMSSSEFKRQYRSAMDMPDLHINKVTRIY